MVLFAFYEKSYYTLLELTSLGLKEVVPTILSEDEFVYARAPTALLLLLVGVLSKQKS